MSIDIDTTIKTHTNELTFSTIPAGEGLSKALAMSRVDIIDIVRESKLKGRGGAGFPTGHQVELRRGREARAQVHHVQRRRGRAGHLQGPASS